MANLYRKKNSKGKEVPNWYCFFRIPSPDGTAKQVHRSTGKKTKKEAEKAALLFEDQALSASGAGDEKSAAILGKLTEAGERAMRGRLNPAHARRILGEIMTISGQVNVAEFTLRGWVDEWLKEKKATTKITTVAFYRTTTKGFLKFMGERADDHIETVTAQDIRGFRDQVRKDGRTAKTCNHKLKGLRALFADAVAANALFRSPTIGIKALSETDSVQRIPFTIEEVGALVSKASPEWHGMILLGAFAGVRLFDAANLKTENIDLDRNVIHFVPMKTERQGTVVEVPMHSELQAYFKKYLLSPFPGTPIFPILSQLKAGGNGGLSWLFSELMKTAEIDPQTQRKRSEGATRNVSALTFHSLRHTFSSWLAKANVPEEVRMKMTGHTESTTHQKYTHQEISTLREGVERLPSLG
jgi:integrase